MKKTIPVSTISKFLKLAGVALLLHVAEAPAAPVANLEAGSYLSGGIGTDGRQAMHEQRAHYNLHLRFAQARTGAYLTGVSVAIAPHGKKHAPLYFDDAGPLLYVRLHPGSYRVTAMAEGKKQVRTVTVGKSASEVVMYWP